MTERHYIEFTVQALGTSREAFHDVVGDVADALANLTGVIDPDLGADLAKRELTFCMTVEAASVDDALAAVVSAARASLHAAGQSTPGWESVGVSIPAGGGDRRLLTL